MPRPRRTTQAADHVAHGSFVTADHQIIRAGTRMPAASALVQAYPGNFTPVDKFFGAAPGAACRVVREHFAAKVIFNAHERGTVPLQPGDRVERSSRIIAHRPEAFEPEDAA